MTKAELAQFNARKGAVRISEIPPQVLALLNAGEIECVNLVEWLALDQAAIVQTVLPQLGLAKFVDPARAALAQLKKSTQTQMLPAIGRALLDAGLNSSDKRFAKLLQHPSDAVRSWAAYVIGHDASLTLAEKFTRIRASAADTNFGVREIAWMAVRPDIDAKLNPAIKLLARWAHDQDENVRRFASEATRPRGVWCKHINALKQNPELAYPILEPLRSDPAKYVRDSVGNWLNDASKSQPAWVSEICAHWTNESPTKETAYIVKKALRTMQIPSA